MSEYVHPKGRGCARTDDVLENYRRRALKAEAEVLRLQGLILHPEQPPHRVKRGTTKVKVFVYWPAEGPKWDDFDKNTRECVRNLMDGITDILEVHL